MKNENTILWIIGIAVVVFLILPNIQTSKEEGMIGLNVHYYQDGKEVFPKFGVFSIVTPPGGGFDQIGINIDGSATNVSFSNIQIVGASPSAFLNALPVTTQTLSIGQSKTLFTSSLIDTVQFEALPQPVRFWINISAVNDYTGETEYSTGFVDLTIEGEGFGDGSDGAVIFTLTTKSYGNLVLGIDYQVSNHILYLKTDRVYNLTSFTLGSGTELRPWSPTGKGAALYIQAKNDAVVEGTVRSSFAYDYNPVRGQSVSTLFTVPDGVLSTPGVANGGSGGYGGYGDNDGQSNGGAGGSQGNGYGGGGGSGGAEASVSENTGGRVGGVGGVGFTAVPIEQSRALPIQALPNT